MTTSKEDKWFYIKMVGWLILLLFLLFIYSQLGTSEIETKESIEEVKISDYSYEKGYYDGQKAALEGDIRLIQVTDTLNVTKWVWVYGPYNNKKTISYIP